MTVYIDKDYLCHTAPGEGLRAVEAAFFQGKAPEFIGGYRFIPAGESWTDSDGTKYQGEAVFPASPWETLDGFQRAYEQAQIVGLGHQNEELVEAMAAMVEEVYASDLAVIEEG